MFDVIGITIEETGEELTVRVGKGKIHIEPGLPDRWDFLVPLKMENVTNMVSHAADGRLDAFETWRIASVLFTPLTRETLKPTFPISTLHGSRQESHPLLDRPEIDWPCRTRI